MDVIAEEEAVKKDKRKAKVLKAAQVVLHKPFVPRLVRFLASDDCSVKDVKQLEAVMQVPPPAPLAPPRPPRSARRGRSPSRRVAGKPLSATNAPRK